MLAAAMVAAGMFFPMGVMVAFCVGIIGKISADEIFHCMIRVSLYTAKKLNVCLTKRHLRAAADSTANKRCDMMRC